MWQQSVAATAITMNSYVMRSRLSRQHTQFLLRSRVDSKTKNVYFLNTWWVRWTLTTQKFLYHEWSVIDLIDYLLSVRRSTFFLVHRKANKQFHTPSSLALSISLVFMLTRILCEITKAQKRKKCFAPHSFARSP